MKTRQSLLTLLEKNQKLLELLEMKSQLSGLLSYYQKPKDSSRKQLENGSVLLNGQKHSVNEEGKKIALKLSENCQLDQIQAYEIYWNFQKSQTLLNNDDLESDMDMLYEHVLQFYYNERICTLNLVSAIFRAGQDPLHSFHKSARELADYISQSKVEKLDFKTQVVELLEQLMNEKVPAALEADGVKAAAWVNQNLLEQKAALSLMILLFYHYIPTAEESQKVVEFLLKHSFGVLQVNRPFFDDACSTVYQAICDLCTILFIEMMNFEFVFGRLFRPAESDPSQEAVIDSPDIMLALHAKIWDSIETFNVGSQEPKPAGVVAVTWACNVQLLMMILTQNCPDHYRELQNQFSQTYDQSKTAQRLFQFGYTSGMCLDYIIRMLDVHSNLKNDPNEFAYRCILKGLVNVVLITQNISALPSRSLLVQCVASVFENSGALCNQFWSYDFLIEDCRSLLETTQRAFPLYFDDFCVLIQSLISNSDTADYVFQYLCQMPSFADYAREKDYQQSFEQIDRTTIWNWIGKTLVVDSPNINLFPPANSIAFEMGKHVLLLKYDYSAWHLFLSLLDSFLHSSVPEAEKSDCIYGNINTIGPALKIISKFLSFADAETKRLFVEHLGKCQGNLAKFGNSPEEALAGLIGEILNRCSTVSSLDINIITYCMNIMKNLVHEYPQVIWKRLRVLKLFPQNATLPVFSPGYIQQFVVPAECQKGSYTATLAFLNLVSELVVESQYMIHLTKSSDLTNPDLSNDLEWVKYDILYCCLLFIQREIFPSYDSWRYERVSQKFEIGQVILTIFNAIMGDSSWFFTSLETRNSKSVCNIQTVLLESLMYKPNSYVLSPFLAILAIGNRTPLEYHMLGRRTEAELLESSILEALLLLKRFLVVLSHQDAEVSGLEMAILESSFRMSNGANAEFIQILASYIDYESSSDFAHLATEVLTLLCKLASKPGKPQASFVGYFGAEAFNLVSKFVELVNEDSKKAAYSDVVQMNVYNFVTSVIESQPGLGAMFLSGYETKSNTIGIPSSYDNSEDVKEGSILHPLNKLIFNWKIAMETKPVVLAAATNLLDSLWQKSKDHHSTLLKLGKIDKFWVALTDILLESKVFGVSTSDCYFTIAQAHILRILATEAFFVIRSTAHVSAPTGQLIIKTLKNALFGDNSLFDRKKVIHDANLTETLLQLCSDIKPPINLNYFRRLTWNDVFDSERISGTSFVYNTELLVRKLNLDNNQSVLALAENLIDQIEKVNANWAQTDSCMAMIESIGFATKLLCSRGWNSVCERPEDKVEQAKVLSLAKKLFTLLSQDSSQTYIRVTYKGGLSSMIFSLISNSLTLNSKELSKHREQMLEFLDQAALCFQVTHFPLGPVGKFSEFPFHVELMSSVLLLLQNLSRCGNDTPVDRKKLDSIYRKLLPIVCHGFYYLLIGQAKCDLQEETLLFSTLFELTRVRTGASLSVWLPIVERYQIFTLLLNAFATWQSGAKNSLSNGPEHILELLLSFSMHAPCSGPLISNGIIAALCNNDFAERISDGSINPYSGSERNMLHAVWKLMLAIVAELTNYLGADPIFMESVVGFLRLYEKQVQYAFGFYLNMELSMGFMEELEKITGLFYRIALGSDSRRIQNVQNEQLLEIPLMSEALENHLRTLALFVFLFKNPHELCNSIQAISKDEKLETETFKHETQSPSKKLTFSPHQTRIKKRMVIIALHIVGFLRLFSQSESMLTSSRMNDFPSLFAPTLTSFHDYGATFGTLFDLLRYLTTLLKTEYDSGLGKPPSEFVNTLIYGSESTLTLLSSQLMIYDGEQDNDTITELRNEFQGTIMDLNLLLKDAVKSWKEGTIMEAREYMIQIGNLFQPVK